MQEILVKIPPSQSKKLRIERLYSDVKFSPNKPTNKSKVVSTSYTHKFVIESSSSPITINLDNIPKDVIPIELAKEEIQKSYDKGFEEGQMSEMAIAKAEINTFMEKMRSLEGAIQEFDNKSNDLLNQLYDSVISISKHVAMSILKAEQLQNSESVVKKLESLFNEAKDSKIISIKMNTDTFENIKELEGTIENIESQKVAINIDDSLEHGDYIFETDSGFVESIVKEEMNNIIQKLESDFVSAKLKMRNELIKKIERGNAD